MHRPRMTRKCFGMPVRTARPRSLPSATGGCAPQMSIRCGDFERVRSKICGQPGQTRQMDGLRSPHRFH